MRESEVVQDVRAERRERVAMPRALALASSLGVLCVAGVVWGGVVWAGAVVTPVLEDLHGATAMEVQASRLAELVGAPSPNGVPPGVDPLYLRALEPADNRSNPDRVALGEKLYFETRLSRDGSVSCATCHDTHRGFTDQRMVSEGIGGKLGRRNAPTTMNVAFLTSAFLDGRAADLEEQARLPITNPIEMGFGTGEEAASAIAGDAEYQALFQKAYGRDPNYQDIGRALAAFERTLIFLDAPIDAFLAGDESAVDDSVKRGWDLFNGKARCAACHHVNSVSPIGTNNTFHNIGVSARDQDFEALAGRALKVLSRDASMETLDRMALQVDLGELGRFNVTKDYTDIGAFRTSQIRNVGITFPYMHDGSMQTLWDVVDHYNKGGEANPYLDGGIEPLALDEAEINDLVALLFAFTDRRFSLENQRAFLDQKARAQKERPFRDDELAHRIRDGFEDRLKGE